MSIIRSNIARQLLAEGGAPRASFRNGGRDRDVQMSGVAPSPNYSSLGEDYEDDVARMEAAMKINQPPSSLTGGDNEPSLFQKAKNRFKTFQTDSRMNRIGAGVLTTPGAIKSVFGFRDVPPELLATLADDYTKGGLYSEGLVGGDISLENAARTFQGLEDLGVDLTGDIRSQVAGISTSKFADRFGPKTPKTEGGDNEAIIKKLRAPITEKTEPKGEKGEFDDILRFYGAKFAKGGRTDAESQYGADSYGSYSFEDDGNRGDDGPPTRTMGGGTGPLRAPTFKNLQTHFDNNAKLAEAVRLGLITNEEYNVLGGYDARQTMGLGPLDTAAYSTAYNLTQSLTGGQPFSNIIGDVARNVKGASTRGISPELQGKYNQIIGPQMKDGGEVRQNYGLGKLVKKIGKTVKKVAKSPLGKAALIGGLGFLGSKTAFGGELFTKFKDLSALKKALLIGGTAATLSPFAMKEEEEDETLPEVARSDPEFQNLLTFYGGPRRFAEDGGDIDKAPIKMASAPDPMADRNDMLEELARKYYKKPLKDLTPDEFLDLENAIDEMSKKQGIQRTMAAGGGMMNPNDEMLDLGGNEMDLRGGGFVPLGEYEKKDDVPARLSKNEFVFTADAVKAAGGGSVDRGADLMYKTMKQLENKVA